MLHNMLKYDQYIPSAPVKLAQLQALPVFLSRTLEERAQRLFSTKGKSLESLDPSLFAKNPKAKGPKK